MKRVIVLLVLVLSFFALAMSCQQAPMLSVSGPRSYTFTRDGGTQSFTFTCNRDWSVSTTESWISVTPTSGSASDGETTVTIKCTPNSTYDPRTATLTIRVEELAETITVNQDTGIGLIVSPKTFDLTNSEQVIEIEVQKNVQYSISIDDAGKSWITHTDTKGLSTEKASFNIAANETYDNREAKITFSQKDGSLYETVVIRQSQSNGLFITTPEYDLSNEAHTLTVEVKANVDYEVISPSEWIKYVSTSTKALTPTQITLQVDENDSYDNREGQVMIQQANGELMGTITIRQEEGHGILLSQRTVNVNKEAQIVEVTVMFNVDIDIIIPYDVQQEMVSSVEYSDDSGGTKALSLRKYRFSITENTTYNERTANITFKQKEGSLSDSFTIIQEPTDFLSCGYDSYYMGIEGGLLDIPLSHNNDYRIDILDDWISLVETKNLVTSLVQLGISENKTSKNRLGFVLFTSLKTNTQYKISILQCLTPVLANTSSNCYIISTPGTYAVPLVFGNSAKKIENVYKASIEWESLSTSDETKVGDILSEVFIDDDFAYITTNPLLTNGNAVVSVKDIHNNVLWSWHLWCCQGYDPVKSAVVLRNDVGVLMDRNLGACSATPGDVLALGLLYQWGRKDPFLNGDSISYYPVTQSSAKSTIAWPSTVKSSITTGTVDYAIANPTTFIYGEEDNDFDWHFINRCDTLWSQSRKTIYDPCPPGWKVPDGGNQNIWGLGGFYSSSLADDNLNRGVIYFEDDSDVTSWYPKAGLKFSYYGNLSNAQIGFSGNYHTNSVKGIYAQSLYFNGKTAFNYWDYLSRSTGASIRCQREENF